MSSKLKKTRILLVDDHPFVLEGLRSYLLTQGRFDVVGEAVTGPEAIAKVRELAPDLVIMDVYLSGMSGLEATRLIRSGCPKVKVLILTMHEKKEFILEIIRSGAQGYVLKSTSPAELLRAIECAEQGEFFFSPRIVELFAREALEASGRIESSGTPELSLREHQVLALIGAGRSNKQIADNLDVSIRTVEKHRGRIMDKVGAHNVVELMRFAIARGLVPP
jgi:two-component system, NarL family, nitrate/nitrite response regulator NarL